MSFWLFFLCHYREWLEKNYRANHDPWLEVVLMSPLAQLIYRLGLIVAYGPAVGCLVGAVVDTIDEWPPTDDALDWWIATIIVFVLALLLHGL